MSEQTNKTTAMNLGGEIRWGGMKTTTYFVPPLSRSWPPVEGGVKMRCSHERKDMQYQGV